MGAKDIGITRLPLLAKAQGFADGEKMVKDLQENIRHEFGDSYSRVSASELVRLRDKYYAPAPERVPGAMKLLDVLIGSLDPEVANAGMAGEKSEPLTTGSAEKKVEVTSARASVQTSSSTGKKAESVTEKAASVLQALGGKPQAGRVSKLSLEDYAKQPTILSIAFPVLPEVPPGEVSVEDAQWSKDGRTLLCTRGMHVHEVDATTGKVATGPKLAAVPSYEGLDWMTLGSGGSHVFARGNNGRVYAWEAKSGALLKNAKLEAVGSSAFAEISNPGVRLAHWLSSDAQRYVSTLDTGVVLEVRPGTGEVTETKCPCQAFRISADGALVLGLGSDVKDRSSHPSSWHKYHQMTGNEKIRLLVRGEHGYRELELEDANVPEAKANPHCALAGFSENGAFAAAKLDTAANWQSWVQVWDTKTGKVRRIPILSSGPVEAGVAITNDGKILADLGLWGTKAKLQLYDIDTGEKLGEPIPLDVAEPEKAKLHFSSDGTRLLVSHPFRNKIIVFKSRGQD